MATCLGALCCRHAEKLTCVVPAGGPCSPHQTHSPADYSPGYADTWQQLERRIDDVLWLGGAAQSVSQSAAALPHLLLQALTAHWQQGDAGSAGQQQEYQHQKAADPGVTSSSGPSAFS